MSSQTLVAVLAFACIPILLFIMWLLRWRREEKIRSRRAERRRERRKADTDPAALTEYEERMKKFLDKLYGAWQAEENRLGRPLSQKEKRRIEDNLDIYEEEFEPTTVPRVVGALFETIADSVEAYIRALMEQQKAIIKTIDNELRYHFGDAATNFTELDKVMYSLLTAEERLKSYTTLKHSLEELQKTPSQPIPKPQPETQLRQKWQSFFSKVEDKMKFADWVQFERAKIRVDFQNDPQSRDKRLMLLDNEVRKFMYEKGW